MTQSDGVFAVPITAVLPRGASPFNSSVLGNAVDISCPAHPQDVDNAIGVNGIAHGFNGCGVHGEGLAKGVHGQANGGASTNRNDLAIGVRAARA